MEAGQRLSFSKNEKKVTEENKPPEELKKQEGENEEEEDEDDDNNANMGGDPKARKMKKALKRFRKKYHDVIKEEKKIQKMKD